MKKITMAALSLCMTHTAYSLEEVIIKAQHREQSIHEVPLSITVFDGDTIQKQGLNRIDHVVAQTPGLTGWEQGISTPIYAIRGISSNSFGIGGEASVAVIIDDAYVGRINSSSMSFLDVDRIEVLKGPQGTLFGRNASAGAVLIYNKQPTNQFEASYRVHAGENNDRGLNLAINTPLIENRLLMRISGFTSNNDGDLINRELNKSIGNERSFGGRAALRLTLDSFDATLSFSDQQTKTNGLGYETLTPALAAAGNVAANPFDDELATDTDTFDEVKNRDAQLRVNWQPNNSFSLLSISAYHENQSPNLFDVDGSAVFLSSAGFIERESETLSQEFRLSSTSESINWVAGAIAFKEQVSSTIALGYSDVNALSGAPVNPADFGLPYPPFQLCDPVSDLIFGSCQSASEELSYQRGDYFSYGLYGDLSVNLSDKLSLTTGLRYSADDKEFQYQADPVSNVTTQLNASPLNPAGNIIGYSTNGWQKIDKKWDDWQPRLGFTYLLNKQQSLYASISKGYKAGGFEPAATPELSSYEPEQVISAELGIRSSAWNQRLNYQLAAFTYDYDDYQIQVVENGLFRTINSAGVDGKGVEFNLDIKADQHWRLLAAYAYTDTQFKSFGSDQNNLGGKRTILTPEHSGHISLHYQTSAFDWGMLSAQWRSEYQSELYFTAQNLVTEKQQAFTLNHLQLTYLEPDQNWQVDLYLRNLTNKDYLIFKQDVGAGPVARRGKPRYFGLAISGKF